jgi:hypothetical protein
MNDDKINEYRDQANELLAQVGEVLDDNPMEVVHMVLGRLFVIVSMESGNPKENYMKLCSEIWDLIELENAEETKH